MQARGPVKRAPKKRSGFKPSAIGRAYAAAKYTPKPKPASRSDAAQRTGARTPKPKPYRPTPAQVGAARAQERAYKSQGKAVKKVAHVQKAQGVGRPTGGRTLVTRKSRRRARSSAGSRREREAKQIKKLVGFDPRERYGYTPRKTKYNVMPSPKGLSKAAKLGYLETDPKKLKAAGFAPPGLAEKIVSAPKYAIKYGIKPAAQLAERRRRPHRAGDRHPELTRQSRRRSLRRGEEVLRGEVPDAARPSTSANSRRRPASSTSTWPSTRARVRAPGHQRADVPARRDACPDSPPARPRASPANRRCAAPTSCSKGTALREQRHGQPRHRRARIAVTQRPACRAACEARQAEGQGPARAGEDGAADPGARAARPPDAETTRGGARRSVVQQRVDEFRDVAQHTRNEVFKKHAKAAQKKAKGKSKTERAAIFAEEREKAVEAADTAVRTRFVKEFGTTGRLSVDLGEVEAAKVEREFAGAAKKEAKGTVAVAAQRQAEALTEARVARASGASRRSKSLEALQREQRTAARETHQEARAARADTAKAIAAVDRAAAAAPKSPQIKQLRSELRTALVAQHKAETAHADAMAEFGVARGRAQVLSRNVAGEKGERAAMAKTVPAGSPQYRGGGHGVELGAQALQKQTRAVDDARARVAELQQKIDAETARATGRTQASAAAKRNVIKLRHGVRVAAGRERREGVRDLQRQVAQERKRISGIPPVQQDKLLRAIADAEEAKATHAAAREAHKGAARTHKDLKKALANAELVEPAKGAQLYDSKAEATRVANLQEFDATTFKAGEQWGVVPKVAKERLRRHGEVGTSKALGARELRVLSRSFRNSVLPLSARWLFGQVSEATFRTALEHGFNPFAVGMSVARERAVYRKLEKMEPGLGKEMRARAVRGGQFGSTSIAREFMGPEHEHTIGEEFADSYAEGVGKAVSKGAQAPVVKQYRERVWHPYKHLIFNVVNGFVEESARRALTGRKIAQGPLMERRILTLTDRAVTDAANGLQQHRGAGSARARGRPRVRQILEVRAGHARAARALDPVPALVHEHREVPVRRAAARPSDHHVTDRELQSRDRGLAQAGRTVVSWRQPGSAVEARDLQEQGRPVLPCWPLPAVLTGRPERGARAGRVPAAARRDRPAQDRARLEGRSDQGRRARCLA